MDVDARRDAGQRHERQQPRPAAEERTRRRPRAASPTTAAAAEQRPVALGREVESEQERPKRPGRRARRAAALGPARRAATRQPRGGEHASARASSEVTASPRRAPRATCPFAATRADTSRALGARRISSRCRLRRVCSEPRCTAYRFASVTTRKPKRAPGLHPQRRAAAPRCSAPARPRRGLDRPRFACARRAPAAEAGGAPGASLRAALPPQSSLPARDGSD